MDRVSEGPEASLCAIVDVLEHGAALFDAHDRLLTCNAAFREINRPVAGLLVQGWHFDDLLAALDRAQLLTESATARKTAAESGCEAGAHRREYRQVGGDGATYRASVRPLETGGFLLQLRRLGEDEPSVADGAVRMYRDLFENAPEGFYRSSLEGRMIAANPALIRLNGYDDEQTFLAAVNNIASEWYVDPRRRREFAEIMERDGVVRGFESEIYRHLTRERIWISEEARLVRDKAGRPLYYEGSVREICAQKQAEAELRASEMRFRQAFEHGLLGLCITDGNGIFQQVNQAYCNFFGYPANELLGQSIAVVLHPNELPDAMEALRRVTAGEEAGGLYRRRYRHKNGRDIWCRVGLSCIDLQGDGGPYVMVQVQDVTDIRDAEVARQSSERRFQDLVEGSIQGVFIHWDWNLLFANDALARMLGYDDVSEIMSLGGIVEFYDEQDRERLLGYAAARTRGEMVPDRYELRCRRRDGSLFWVEHMVTVVEWGGKPAMQVTVIDIDERKQAELDLRTAKEEAERASRSKSEFLANMSHELRTPLNAILGFSEVITDELFGELNNRRYLDYARDINDSGKHLLQVINDILDLSRIEAGKLELDLEATCLHDSVMACFRLLRSRAQDAGVTLIDDLTDGIPMLRADAVKLKQILLNLLANAIKFTPVGGNISVQAQLRPSGELDIVVEDSGIGMTPQEVQVALSPFGQVESVLARRHHGTGLGLPLVQSLVDLHGGELSIRSAPGVGTRIAVVWPRDLVIVDVDAGRAEVSRRP